MKRLSYGGSGVIVEDLGEEGLRGSGVEGGHYRGSGREVVLERLWVEWMFL